MLEAPGDFVTHDLSGAPLLVVRGDDGQVPLTPKARAYWDANNAILYRATDEDFALGESIQRGLASGANDDLLFGAFEHALAHFHDEVARHLA